MNLKKTDFQLLFKMIQLDAISPLKGLPINKIMQVTESSRSTVRRNLLLLIDLGFVEYGYYIKNSRTYYVTPDGVKKISDDISLSKAKNIILDYKEDVEDE